jgi:cytochrome c553
MAPIFRISGIALLLAGPALVWPARAHSADISAGDFFEAKIRPLLAANCYQCHGDKKQESDLRLDSRAAVMKGGSDGPVIVPGQPDKSLLVKAVRYQGDTKMPPTKQLPADAVAALTTWVTLGAPWPDSPASGGKTAGGTALGGTDGAGGAGAIADAKRHWAFQPVREPSLPAVKNALWVQSPIDAFILAKLESQAIPPAAAADRRTLIRRATFDLLGLPPTPGEVEAFVKDSEAGAFDRVVDRLLASPHYGERWGRYWLDVARYSDNKGYVFNQNRELRFAYLYRDWVIRALNNDLPYDQFLVKQIAADRLPHSDNLDLPAMGLLTVGRRFIGDRQLIIDDQIDVVCRGMLGLTVTCARCHNHKFDPIPTDDYYSLYGVMNGSEEKEVPLKPGAPEKALIEEDRPQQTNPHIFIRGNAGNQGAEVPRRFLAVLSGPDRQPFHDGSGRLELARRIASPDNPLTARVIVNRIWLHHFGEGLVRTPSDFGARSDPPTHPALLDYLAARLVKDGWSIKRLQRLIMLSSVYQESSDGSAKGDSLDPENRLLSHFNRQRLDFEAMRDALLAVGGELDEKIGGPSINLIAEPFVRRRTIYSYVDRQNLQGLLRTFDFASPDAHSPMRHVTTIPQQALFLLNSPFVVQQAERLAARPEIAKTADPVERIRRMYQLVYSRAPTAEEVTLAQQYLAAAFTVFTEKPNPVDKLTPWQRYAQALLMTNEFVYID